MFTERQRVQFRLDVYEVVRQIPVGRVLTYGDVARLVGFPQLSRLVGRTLSAVPRGLALPCHRVVNANGRLVLGWKGQADLLKAEGVEVRLPKGGTPRVDIRQYRWRIPEY